MIQKDENLRKRIAFPAIAAALKREIVLVEQPNKVSYRSSVISMKQINKKEKKISDLRCQTRRLGYVTAKFANVWRLDIIEHILI